MVGGAWGVLKPEEADRRAPTDLDKDVDGCETSRRKFPQRPSYRGVRLGHSISPVNHPEVHARMLPLEAVTRGS